ncbi:DUF418 domain-containing protein [Flammeovirgaceae bacterium SG7u.111]|nr:DUF418 domain-containing protein [Flammeovirgaceae bacterium SG7u.132]WPO34582.1 DUF418 domain-containing protein [Flammeovirgaceae bacterium SG7u.111]
MPETTKPQVKQPTKAKDRIVFLDILRGFALVGILFANILSWSGIKFLPYDSIVDMGSFDVDRTLYQYLKFFVDTKFYTIFSLLFGVGFCIQISRNKDNPKFPPLYLKRLFLLMIIGLLHALVWSGDILMLYALMGMILLALRNVDVKKAIWVGLGLYFFPIILDVIYMYTFAADLPVLEKTALKVYPDASPEEIVLGFQSTDLVTVFKTNFHNVIWRWYDFIPSGRPFKVLGLFFLGYLLFSADFFTVHAKKWKSIILFLSLGIGFTSITMFLTGSVSSFSKSWVDIFDKLLHEIGQLSLALAYVSILSKLVDSFPKFIGFTWLKDYGRMSMTSYLGHTFLGILVFYPIIGWGYFGLLSLEEIYYGAVVILVIQLIFSVVWFKFFHFGPIEWLWRCATYGKWFPIKKIEKK